MNVLLHSFEMYIHISSEDMYELCYKYGINVSRYQNIGAAVEKLNIELKRLYPAYAIVFAKEL